MPVAAVPLLAAEGGVDIARFFLVLATMLVTAKLLGELAERIGQPAVLGELVAGVLLGGSVLGVVPDRGAGRRAGARPRRARRPAAAVRDRARDRPQGDVPGRPRVALGRDRRRRAAVRLRLSSTGLCCRMPAGPAADLTTAGIFVGATLTATSVGITARVLSDLGRMSTPEARIIIGAAVIDDVLGLVILSVVSGLAAGAAVQFPGDTADARRGRRISGRGGADRPLRRAPPVRRRRPDAERDTSWSSSPSPSRSGSPRLASLAGSALIIGAFAAGLILSGTNQFDTIEHEVKPIASIFTPIFFVSVGASVNLGLLNPATPESRATLLVAGALIVIAIVGKLAAGWAAPWSQVPPARRRRRHGAPGRGRPHLRRHRPPLGSASRRGVRRGSPHGDGDYVRRAPRPEGPVLSRG